MRLIAPGGAFAAAGALDPMLFESPSGVAASLTMPPAEDRRGTFIASGFTTLLHAAVFGAIVLVGYFAPTVVEEIIPVTILSEAQPLELPGSNDPALIPKMLAAIPAASAAAIAAPAAIAALPAAAQAPSLEAAAPTQIDMAQVTSQPLAAQSTLSPTPSAANITDVKPLDIDPADLLAPTIDRTGPTAMAPQPNVDVTAPQNFEQLGQIDPDTYRSAAVGTVTRSTNVAGHVSGTEVTTGIADEFMTGGGGYEGGSTTGQAGTVPCMQSAYVLRYKDEIERRTKKRWVLPLTARPSDVVTLGFRLDYAGAVTRIEVVSATTEEFGSSAMRALKMASPFPPLDDNVRCLANMKVLKLKFTNPSS